MAEHEELIAAGEVICDELILTAQDGTNYLIKDMMIEFNLFEDIFSPFLHGTITLSDAVNAISMWPISGGEVLTVKFRTKTFEDAPGNLIEKSFQIVGIENRMFNNDREQFYSLSFCSIEAVNDQSNTISQSFGVLGSPARTTDQIAEQIWNDWIDFPRRIDDEGSRSSFVIGDTPHSSKIQFVSNFWTPMQIMQFISRRCQGAAYAGSDYLFFESNKGFFLTSIQNLIASQQDALWEEFIYAPEPIMGEKMIRAGGENFVAPYLHPSFNKITEMSVPRTINILDGQDTGYYCASTRAYDMFTKEQAEVILDGRDSFDKFVHTDPGIPIPGGIQRNPFSYINIKYLNQVMYPGMHGGLEEGVKGAGANPAILANDLFRQVYFNSFNDYKFALTMPGRTDIEVGKLIKLVYPAAGPKTEDSEAEDYIDQVLTGRYLITAIHHTISSFTKHSMKLEIVKNGLALHAGPEDDEVISSEIS